MRLEKLEQWGWKQYQQQWRCQRAWTVGRHWKANWSRKSRMIHWVQFSRVNRRRRRRVVVLSPLRTTLKVSLTKQRIGKENHFFISSGSYFEEEEEESWHEQTSPPGKLFVVTESNFRKKISSSPFGAQIENSGSQFELENLWIDLDWIERQRRRSIWIRKRRFRAHFKQSSTNSCCSWLSEAARFLT